MTTTEPTDPPEPIEAPKPTDPPEPREAPDVLVVFDQREYGQDDEGGD